MHANRGSGGAETDPSGGPPVLELLARQRLAWTGARNNRGWNVATVDTAQRGVVSVADDRARGLSLTVMLLVLVAAMFTSGLDGPVGWIVLAAGLLIGLPHGAVDHLVPGLVLGRPLPRQAFVMVVTGYIAVAAAAFALFAFQPVFAAALFLVVSVGHFGVGDVEIHEAQTGRRLRGRPSAVLAFGLPAIALPIAIHPDAVTPVLAGLAPSLTALTAPGVRAALLAFTLVAVGLTVVIALADGRGRVALDLLVLVAVFAVAPPLIAFAAYFGCWHAARHIGRLLTLDPANREDLARGRLARPLLRFAGSAAGPTAISVAVLAGLWWGAGGVEGLVAAHLGLLLALTMPHVAVVSWLDRRRGAHRSDARQVPA